MNDVSPVSIRSRPRRAPGRNLNLLRFRCPAQDIPRRTDGPWGPMEATEGSVRWFTKCYVAAGITGQIGFRPGLVYGSG